MDAKDGRLEAGDQLLKVNGDSLIGVSQEKAAEFITKTGPVVTLEVAKKAANFNGLAGILNQASPPLVSRNVSRSHPASSGNPSLNSYPSSLGHLPHSSAGGQLTSMMHPLGGQQYHSMSSQQQQQFFPQTQGAIGLSKSMTMTPRVSSSMTTSSLQGMMHPHQPQPQQLQAALNQKIEQLDSLIQEERHYQNIGMYRQQSLSQQQLPTRPLPPSSSSWSNMIPSNGSASMPRALNNHNVHQPSYSSWRQLPPSIHPNSSMHLQSSSLYPPSAAASISQSALPSGRPMSQVYPPSIQRQYSGQQQQYTQQMPYLVKQRLPNGSNSDHVSVIPGQHQQSYRPNHVSIVESQEVKNPVPNQVSSNHVSAGPLMSHEPRIQSSHRVEHSNIGLTDNRMNEKVSKSLPSDMIGIPSADMKEGPPPLPTSPPPQVDSPVDVPVTPEATGSRSNGDATLAGLAGMSLQDIDTPNVIGSQEVYRDPRERMMLEKMKNKVSQGSLQGPEELSFREKIAKFAMTGSGDKKKQQESNVSLTS